MDLKEQLQELAKEWRQRAKEICTGDDRVDNATDRALVSCADELERILGN